VEVPGGIEEGQQLRMPEAGEAGKKGGRPGDLYVRVHITPHPKFVRDGEHIRSVEHILFSTAIVGGKVDIDTIDGTVKLKIPPGTPSGRIFRLRNRGAKRLQGKGRGDHLVRIEVAVPGKLNKEQKKLILEMKKHGL
jgi:molecular chaperone DnaJ